MAVDYFQNKYPASMVVFDMTLVYIVMSFFAVLANNVLVNTVSFTCRINIGTYAKRDHGIQVAQYTYTN